MKEYLRKNYDEGADIFGDPQVYKTIKLWPIKIRDLKYQNLLYQMFAHPKNYIADRDILRASYLKFLIYVVSANYNSGPEEYLEMLKDLLSHVTKIDKNDILWEWKDVGGEGLNQIQFQLNIGGIKLLESDIDDIREILLEQNASGIDYVEEYNPQLEESLRFINRNSDNITLMDEVFTFSTLMKLSMKEIEDYTFFQFRSSFEKVLTLKEYDIYKPMIATGEITLKNGELKHYFYHSAKQGRYASVLMKEEDFLNGDVGDILK